MNPQTKTTAKDFFLHLGILVSLYAGVGFLLNLLFSVINTAFPKVTNYYGYTGSISFPVAALIVLTPVFLVLSTLVAKAEEADASKREIWIKRWSTYLTMFGAGAIIVIDLITLVYFFLDGQELTAGFLLKVLAVLVVAGALFGYYLSNLKNTLTKTSRNIWSGGVILLVLVSIVLGFTVIGSPRDQRLMRYDSQKVSDLEGIQYQLVNYYQTKGELPASLQIMNDPLSSFYPPKDPQTGADYEYQKTGALSFSLCAQFNRASDGNPMSHAKYYPVDSMGGNWEHDEGRICFDRTIDPELYPIYER